ncbi:MAG: short-chain fatty acyl-CoA regulator family protein [Rhodobacter sp.]|nr:short-chain fatty acyl-CoA regulator family protein [Rhodobacter sp.]
MPARALTGSRIRERRAMLGLKQAALARTVGISAAYLNLIEHNKRRIGGKLLVDLARALDVDPAVLAEGAEAELISTLRDASARSADVQTEAARVEEFAGRFPGWADLVASQHRRIGRLERTIETLTDRMAHDPHLAASLHELLSTVTSINSAASILVEPGEVEPEWRDRFHRNIHEDSQRLVESSRALVTYLDTASEAETGAGSPQEELEAWLKAQGYHIAEMERALPVSAEALVRGAEPLATQAGRDLAAAWLERYRADAVKMPLAEFRDAAEALDYDPARLADRFGADLAAVLRRLASLPEDATGCFGLVICDGSGALTFRKPVEGFPLPRFGAACPLWPLYQALSRPVTPVRALVEMSGRDPVRFLTYAVSQPASPAGFDTPTVFEATMLMLPADRAPVSGLPVLQIGTSCRICPQGRCAARREPSILAEGKAG